MITNNNIEKLINYEIHNEIIYEKNETSEIKLNNSEEEIKRISNETDTKPVRKNIFKKLRY